MTHDPTKGCYTLDTLRALNPLYDHEHGLTQQDVEAVNAMKKYIESTRSADRPHCGDRVRYVSMWPLCPLQEKAKLPTCKTIEIAAYSVPCGFWVGIVVRGLPLLRVG